MNGLGNRNKDSNLKFNTLCTFHGDSAKNRDNRR